MISLIAKQIIKWQFIIISLVMVITLFGSMYWTTAVLEKHFDERFTAFEKRLDERFDAMEKRFDENSKRLEKRFDDLQQAMSSQK